MEIYLLGLAHALGPLLEFLFLSSVGIGAEHIISKKGQHASSKDFFVN